MPPGPIVRLLIDGFSIILIDLLLAGDNALVIAMAVRALPKRQRRLAILCGAGAAVALRVVITILAARLLGVEFLKLFGGVFVIWIAVKVLSDAGAPPKETAPRNQFLQAIWLIVFADITMSVDNVLAVAGAARGNTGLIVFGLGVSIPFVVFSSNLIILLMDRYPAIVYLGSAILGKVGAEMIVTDPFVARTVHPAEWAQYAAQGLVVAGVLLMGRWVNQRARRAGPVDAPQ